MTQWLKDFLSDKSSSSFGRGGAATVIYFLLLWSTYIVSKTAVIPFGPAFWWGLVTFLYLGGKGIDAYNSKGVANVDAVTPPVGPV